MRKLFIISIFLIIAANLFAQLDTAKKQLFCITGSTGMFFIENNKLLKSTYQSQSDFIYAFGIKFGDTDVKLHPFIEFSSFILSDSIGDVAPLRAISFQQNTIRMGIIDNIPIKHYNTYARIKAGVAYYITKENYNKINEQGVGLCFGLGIERKLSEEFSYYLDAGYDYRKISTKRLYGYYGGFRIDLGLYLNLMVPVTNY